MNDGERPAMDDTLTSVSSASGQRDRTQEWLDGHLYSSPTFNATLNDNDDEDQEFATRLYSLCLRLLLFLCQREQNVPSKRSKVANLKEELGKLYLWGEAFRSGKLDRALEYSNDVRGNVLDTLGDIGKLLLRELWPSSISKLPGGSLQKSVHELKFLVEQTKDITSTKDHAATINESNWADESDTDEENSSDDDDATNIVDELRLQTRWLTQLGPILEQNLVSAQKSRIQASLPAPVPFSVSGPAKIYVSLVREKYKLAQDRLVERLGEANWQRHISVRNSMEASAKVVEETTAPVENPAVARSMFRPYSTFHDSALGPSIPEQTEYAPSHTSFQSSNTEGERESIRVPATPVEVTDGKPFRCFLCKCILSNIKNRVDWKMHFFADLQPYICTFADCEDELAQFPNRAAWAEHEFSQHRITQSWSCPECSQAFNNVTRWQNHIQERHCLFFSDRNLNIAKDMAYKTEATRIEDDECPLCRIVLGKPRRAFAKHVGRHMEEIALMALPRNVEEDSEEGSVSTGGTNTSFWKSRTSFQADPSVKERVVSEANTSTSGSPTPFACEHCDQTFSKSSELIDHNIVHTQPFRCVVPECKFPGGRYQKDLDRHVREKHRTTIDLDPESVLAEASTKALPGVKDHITDRPDNKELKYIAWEYDSSGEAKISPVGQLLGGRVFRIRTFVIPHRSETHLMLGTECARVLGYRDSYLFFSKNRSLLKIIATQQDKDDLIRQEILPFSYRSRQIALVTAKSIFRQFGARVVEGGRKVRDDYWEAKAVKDGFTKEDKPGDRPSRGVKTAGVAGQAEHSQGGAAQHCDNFPKQSYTVTGGAGTAPKASYPYPGDVITRIAEGESLIRSANSGAWPLPDQDLRMVDPFREQSSPSKKGRDSRVREGTPSSTTNSSAQRSSSLETSTPRQYENSRQHMNDVDLINVGRVDALGPPSQDYPVPAPPLWLSQALVRLQQTYPDDLSEATMRYTAVSRLKDLPKSLAPNDPVPPDTKFMYYPHIKCLDCPEKWYLPGPGVTADNFETHLKSRFHREKVERRRKLVLPNAQEPAPAPPKESPTPSKPRHLARNEYFVSRKGIHIEVLQREILKYLGPEATARPAFYNGHSGYIITAVRPLESVKNLYNGKIQEGESGQQLEEEAERATAMAANGVDMGPLPVPTSTQRWEDTTRPMA